MKRILENRWMGSSSSEHLINPHRLYLPSTYWTSCVFVSKNYLEKRANDDDGELATGLRDIFKMSKGAGLVLTFVWPDKMQLSARRTIFECTWVPKRVLELTLKLSCHSTERNRDETSLWILVLLSYGFVQWST